ncbi:MAG: FAD-binding oxidoreductase [Armatimonadetes bacterium]|nr:FAD-binding oxidoreductase [Armatimonadota bacterium]
MKVEAPMGMGLGVTPDRVEHVAGFGMLGGADAFVFRPTRAEEIAALFNLARDTGRKVCLRGAGRSYGDANYLPESILIDLCRMNRILGWDPETGIFEGEGGVTIEEVWRHTLEDGWWLPVVSGTMFPTLGGALAMNIHGKNNFREGTLGEHVLELDLLSPDGKLRTLTPTDPLFFAAISGAGLLGAIVRVKLQLKKVECGELQVLPVSCANWEEQFAAFEQYESEADYLVSWIDAFGHGKSAGRGLIHAAWYTKAESARMTLRPSHQDLPDTVMGIFPKSAVWRKLRWFNRRFGMRLINAAKSFAGRKVGDGKPYSDTLVGFSFLLDYVPNWRWAYLPDGFIQYQSFVPKEHARYVFGRQLQMQREARLESFLVVMKRHRPDPFLLSHGVDGYSLAMDFKVTQANRERLWDLCHRMNDLVLESKGRFYLAKDSTLRPSDVERYLGAEALASLRSFKSELDPDGVLSSALAERLGLGGKAR